MRSDHRDNYRADIDGLRAVSILSVVIYHAFPSLLPGGFVGVDVFFVISGYLITSIIIRGHAVGDFSVAGFYRRRVQRILPAVVVVLAFCLLAGWLVLLPGEYALLGQHTASASVFLPNVMFWSEVGYFDAAAELKPLLHLWSLGVEEQFYLLWPMLLLFLYRLNVPLLPLLIVTAVISFAAQLLVLDRDAAAAFYLPQYRAWELLAGGSLACGPALIGRRKWPGWLAVPGLLMIAAAGFLVEKEAGFPGWWALLPVSGAVLIIAAGPGGSLNKTLLSHPLMVWTGRISFSLYLWHWPLLSFLRLMEGGGEPPSWLIGTAVALSFLLAWLSLRLVETPLRYHRHRLTPWALVATLLGLGGLGFYIYERQGFPQRQAELLETLEVFEWRENGEYLYLRDDCSQDLGLKGRCLSNRRPHQVAILGDSHAVNMFFLLDTRFRDTDTGLLQLGLPGCPGFAGVQSRRGRGRDWCQGESDRLVDYLASAEAITTVFLVVKGTNYLPPEGEKPRFNLRYRKGPIAGNNKRVYRRGLGETLDKLTSAGKRVVVVLEWPDMGFDVRTCVDTRPFRLLPWQPTDCGIARAEHDRRVRVHHQMVGTLVAQYPGAQTWDLAELICDENYCNAKRGDLMLYRDRSHLSLPASRHLGETLDVPGMQHDSDLPE